MSVTICPQHKPWPVSCRGCQNGDCQERAQNYPWQPTQEQIAAACEEIRRGWSEATARHRADAADVEPYQVPEVRLSCGLPIVRGQRRLESN